MTKSCPFMSFRNSTYQKVFCLEKECALWDKEKEQCCLKSAALAVADKKSGGSGSVPLQAEYVYPTPAVISSGSSDWVNPHTYTITCDLGGTAQ